MKFIRMVLALLMCAFVFVHSQRSAVAADADAKHGDVRSFALHPIAPPLPALKYQLLFDPADKHSGNAAIPYLQAAIVIPQGADALQEKCFDDINAGNDSAFREHARNLPGETSAMFQFLELAGQCDSCEWQPPMRERGTAALLPHLNEARMMANLLRLRALLQVREDHIEHALSTLRLGYELSGNVGREPVMVSGLVSIGIRNQMNETLAELMSRPDAPNLYWALASLPQPMISLRRSMEGERLFIYGSMPLLLRARNGEDLSAEDWRTIIHQLAEIRSQMMKSPEAPGLPATALAAPDLATSILPAAKEWYAKSRKLPEDQAARLDPNKVTGSFCFKQYIDRADDLFKVMSLPYPRMIERLTDLNHQWANERDQSVDNPFLSLLPRLDRAAKTFAWSDREIAALTAVEALRSYAAANNGKLPARLDEITDTPVPVNPVTAMPFEYGLNQDGSATLRDSQTVDYPLEYTVRVKQ